MLISCDDRHVVIGVFGVWGPWEERGVTPAAPAYAALLPPAGEQAWHAGNPSSKVIQGLRKDLKNACLKQRFLKYLLGEAKTHKDALEYI